MSLDERRLSRTGGRETTDLLLFFQADKLLKAFSYVDAAMFFVESGVAMENDHHISTSSYTMFAETVELLK